MRGGNSSNDSVIDIIQFIIENGEAEAEKEIERISGGIKKGIILHGNCNMNPILRILLCNASFRAKYYAMRIPAIQNFKPEEKDVFLNSQIIWKNCNLLITQEISDENRFERRLSSGNITSVYKAHNKKAEILIAPKLYFDPYFITKNPAQTIVSGDLIPNGLYPHNELILDKLAEKYNGEDIVKIVQDENLFTERFVNWCLDTRMNHLYALEKNWDIKIMDYISENFRKKMLFWSINHPTKDLVVEISKRILAVLSCYPIEFDRDAETRMEIPRQLIYPSTSRWLRLEFTPPLYNDWENVRKFYTFEEYVRRYVKLCWGK